MRINKILDNFLLEKWNPSNKDKHAACKAKVKSKVKVWPSAYASGQVVQCYYGKDVKESKMQTLQSIFERNMTEFEMSKEKKLHKKISKKPFIKQYGDRGEEVYYGTIKKMAMEENDCGCNQEETINEAEKKRGSPWFIDKETRNNNPHTSRKQVTRNHPNRSKMSRSQIAARQRIGRKLIAKYRKRGLSLSDKAPSDPAKTVEEIIWATATRAALNGMSGSSKKAKKAKKKGPTRFEQKMAKKEEAARARKENIRAAVRRKDEELSRAREARKK